MNDTELQLTLQHVIRAEAGSQFYLSRFATRYRLDPRLRANDDIQCRITS